MDRQNQGSTGQNSCALRYRAVSAFAWNPSSCWTLASCYPRSSYNFVAPNLTIQALAN